MSSNENENRPDDPGQPDDPGRPENPGRGSGPRSRIPKHAQVRRGTRGMGNDRKERKVGGSNRTLRKRRDERDGASRMRVYVG